MTANMAFTPHLTLKMTTTKVVETSVNIDTNSPFRDSTNLDDLHPQICKILLLHFFVMKSVGVYTWSAHVWKWANFDKFVSRAPIFANLCSVKFSEEELLTNRKL